ncbi:rhomboid-related protein 2 isoform X1 [Cydia strobilella]|uniref:rhomboid-related protein 2 isoform X1 n=2 Tax=Cydia strobilella TaxID=1100964 RepID=UPI003004E110
MSVWVGSGRAGGGLAPPVTTAPLLSTNTSMESGIEAGVLPTVTGSLASARDSLGSLSRAAEPLYDTDHTDLGSELDEAEIRRELMHDKWRLLFDRFDPEGFGEIPWLDFLVTLQNPDFKAQVPPHKQEILLDKAQSATSDSITFQEFVNVMSGKRTRSYRCAVHQRDREVSSENDFRLLLEDPTFFARMVHLVAMEVLPEERERKYYQERYTCCPPPLFIICVTLLELGVFAWYAWGAGGVAAAAGPVPVDSPLVYRPDRRHELWRFLTYSVVHAGWLHLAFNLLVQLAVGLPLEMVHGALRCGAVYLAGVLGGSLAASVLDPDVCLAGASGGVYALLAAHLANALLNFHAMRYGAVRLVAALAVASCDVGFAVHARYTKEAPPVSYAAHVAGALAGLTIGLLVLKHAQQRLWERLLWWAALGAYAACTLFAVLYNVFSAPIEELHYMPPDPPPDAGF